MNGFIEQICSSISIYLFILNELSIVCLIYLVLNFLIFNFFLLFVGMEFAWMERKGTKGGKLLWLPLNCIRFEWIRKENQGCLIPLNAISFLVMGSGSRRKVKWFTVFIYLMICNNVNSKKKKWYVIMSYWLLFLE